MDLSSPRYSKKRQCALITVAVGLILVGTCGATNCQTMAGSNWDDYGWPTVITQGEHGQLTVSQQNCGIGFCFSYQGTGTLNLSTGEFSFTVQITGPTGINGVNAGVSSVAFHGMLSNSCNYAYADSVYTYEGGASVNSYDEFTKPCDIPSGETSISTGSWQSVGPFGAAWNQTLLPSSFNFGGRHVREDPDPLDPSGSEACSYQGSPFTQMTTVTGGEWDVDDLSSWGTDWIGPNPLAVTWYRDPLNQGHKEPLVPSDFISRCQSFAQM